MLRFDRMRTVQSFFLCPYHANGHNHLNQEHRIVDLLTYKYRHSAALAEWRFLTSRSALRILRLDMISDQPDATIRTIAKPHCLLHLNYFIRITRRPPLLSFLVANFRKVS